MTNCVSMRYECVLFGFPCILFSITQCLYTAPLGVIFKWPQGQVHQSHNVKASGTTVNVINDATCIEGGSVEKSRQVIIVHRGSFSQLDML